MRAGNDCMRANLFFSEQECAVMAELLERERRQLLIEIRHTDTASYRQDLRDRLTTVESALARLQPVGPASV